LLQPDKLYNATVSYAGKAYTWTFTTTAPENMSQDDKMKMQEISDQNYAQWQRPVDNNYPWYNKLPLQTSNYFVYFDIEKKSFVGLLYPTNSSQNQTISQVVSMKAEIRKSLSDLGVDTAKYNIEWTVKPE